MKCAIEYDIVEGVGIDPSSFIMTVDGRVIGKVDNFELSVSSDQNKCMMFIRGPEEPAEILFNHERVKQLTRKTGELN
jgi:sporulation protein YlmC with PRC-barrel domain